ncbi:MAG: hypothetical protein FJ152_02735 [Firmicutes bacterium]|nr:hypothetical protein [Bacillota bacterium]
MNGQDEKNLDLLANLHLILGIFTALMACLPIIYLAIGIAIFIGATSGGEAAPRIVGLVFIILALVIILAGWVLAVLILIASRKMKKRESITFCVTVAFLECLIMPLGTVLGIFTILNLNKDTTKELFIS